MSEDRASHPAVSSIIRKRDRVYEALSNQDYEEALDRLLLLLMELRPEDRGKSEGEGLKDELLGLLEDLHTVEGSTPYIRGEEKKKLIAENRFKLMEFYETLNTLIWEGRYLIYQSYSGDFWDPSGGKISE